MEQKIALDVSGFNDIFIEIISAEADVDGILHVSFLLHYKTESMHGWGNDVHRWELHFELEELVDDSSYTYESEKFFSFTETIGVHPFAVAEAIINKLNDIVFIVPTVPTAKHFGSRIITSYSYRDQLIYIPITSESDLFTLLEQGGLPENKHGIN